MSEVEQESLAPATGPAAAASGKPTTRESTGTLPEADLQPETPADDPPAGEDAQAEAEKEKRATKYVVLTSDTATGPWEELGEFSANGQVPAKNAGAEKVSEGGGDAQKKYFLAVPSTSYVPQKPTIKVVTSWD